MPRKCTICQHPELSKINQAIVANESLRSIAKHYGLSPSAVERHAKNHIPATLVEAKKAEEVANADDLLAQVRDLKDKALSILETAEEAGELRTALTGIREARGCVELLAKMLCEMDRRERGRPGRPETRSIAPLTRKKLVINRAPQDQREFEHVINKIRESAEEAGLELPEG